MTEVARVKGHVMSECEVRHGTWCHYDKVDSGTVTLSLDLICRSFSCLINEVLHIELEILHCWQIPG